MSKALADAISFDVNPNANWPQAVSELRLMKGQRVSLQTATNRGIPKDVSSTLGVLSTLEFRGQGIHRTIAATVGETEITIDADSFLGAEVTAGYVAFILEGVHLSLARWVPSVTPVQSDQGELEAA